MKPLAEKFKMPPQELVPVTLKSGTENGGVDEFCPGKTMNVPRWDFQKVVISYLLDPILFGNRDNLVSRDNPWEKFEIANPRNPRSTLQAITTRSLLMSAWMMSTMGVYGSSSSSQLRYTSTSRERQRVKLPLVGNQFSCLLRC
jgi:hypothetical protein